MNCNHAAASRLIVLAGWNSWRVDSSRLTVRGLGLSNAYSLSGCEKEVLGTDSPREPVEDPTPGIEVGVPYKVWRVDNNQTSKRGDVPLTSG
jgi:hypothetical protein